MIKRLAVLVSLVAFVATAASTPAMAEDGYTAQANTSCAITTPDVVKRGATFVADVNVRSNSPDRPRGEVKVELSRAGAGQVWSTTVDYAGGATTVRGPALDQAGDYRVDVSFVPADRSVFRGCTGNAAFEVSKGLGPNDEDDNDPDDGGTGFLPDTGGPGFWLLVLGLALVGTGSTLVVVARRRRPTPSFG